MDHRTEHPANRDKDSESLPSADQVVERLERMWSAASFDALRGEEIRGLSFGRYELQQIRGQGAFGIVYLAIDTQLHRHVALKVPRIQVLADAQKRGRFEAEASAAAMLDHPGIVTVYEADLAGPTPFIASAFCPGPDLGEWLAGEHAPIAWNIAAAFIAQLADAVQYAHDHGVYHRDLKPSNVLLMPVGQHPPTDGGLDDYLPKLTDFGLAKLAEAAAADTRSSLLIGTPLYMAPEQLESSRGAPPAAADIYSLGCLLYELVAGRPPIEGETYVQVLDRLREQAPTPLRRLSPAVSKDLERVSAKCLEKDPLARYTSADQLAADLRACIDGAPIQARETSPWSRFRYWCTRPQRIRDAGWYTLCIQVLLIVWTGIGVVGAPYFNFYPAAEMNRLWLELTALGLAVNLPMIVAAWYTTRHRRWAIYAGMILSAVNLIIPLIFVTLSERLFFADIYAKIDSSNFYAFTSCMLVFLAELGQVLLYASAISAWRRMPQSRMVKTDPELN